VLALQGTTAGDFNRNLHGYALAGLALMQVSAEFAVR
jgi:hypothetical protein